MSPKKSSLFIDPLPKGYFYATTLGEGVQNVFMLCHGSLISDLYLYYPIIQTTPPSLPLIRGFFYALPYMQFMQYRYCIRRLARSSGTNKDLVTLSMFKGTLHRKKTYTYFKLHFFRGTFPISL